MLYPADAADSLDFTALKAMVGERAATPQARRRIEELQPEFRWEAQAEELEFLFISGNHQLQVLHQVLRIYQVLILKIILPDY